jgi:hypothetical protein
MRYAGEFPDRSPRQEDQDRQGPPVVPGNPEPQYHAPPPPWVAPPKQHKDKSSVGKTVAIVFGVILLLGIGGISCGIALFGGAASVIEKSEQSRAADITITSCTKTIIDTVEVQYQIVNSATVAQAYFPTFEILDTDGTRVGEAVGFENDIPAGSTVKGTAAGTITGGADKFTCKLTSS